MSHANRRKLLSKSKVTTNNAVTTKSRRGQKDGARCKRTKEDPLLIWLRRQQERSRIAASITFRILLIMVIVLILGKVAVQVWLVYHLAHSLTLAREWVNWVWKYIWFV